MNYKITLTDEAKAFLLSLDGKTRTVIARKIEALKASPEKQGKALSGDLSGYRSLHAADPPHLTSIYEKTKNRQSPEHGSPDQPGVNPADNSQGANVLRSAPSYSPDRRTSRPVTLP